MVQTHSSHFLDYPESADNVWRASGSEGRIPTLSAKRKATEDIRPPEKVKLAEQPGSGIRVIRSSPRKARSVKTPVYYEENLESEVENDYSKSKASRKRTRNNPVKQEKVKEEGEEEDGKKYLQLSSSRDAKGIKGEDNKGLSEGAKEAILKHLTPYQMPSDLPDGFTKSSVTRYSLVWGFGFSPDRVEYTLYSSNGKGTPAMCSDHTRDTNAPLDAGQHGIFVASGPTSASFDPVPGFTRVSASPDSWLYTGHYQSAAGLQMPSAVWRKQGAKFKKTWLDALFGEDYYYFRATIYLAKKRIPLRENSINERMADEKQAIIAMKTRARTSNWSKERKIKEREKILQLSRRKIEEALDDGTAHLYTVVLTCVQYDIGFQEMILDNYEEWGQAPNDPRRRRARPIVRKFMKAQEAMGTDIVEDDD